MKRLQYISLILSCIPLLFVISLVIFYLRAALALGHFPVDGDDSGILMFGFHRRVTLALMVAGLVSMGIVMTMVITSILTRLRMLKRSSIIAFASSVISYVFLFYLDPFGIVYWLWD